MTPNGTAPFATIMVYFGPLLLGLKNRHTRSVVWFPSDFPFRPSTKGAAVIFLSNLFHELSDRGCGSDSMKVPSVGIPYFLLGEYVSR